MAVKTITITEDAYKRLAAMKMASESFSKVISRMTGKVKLLDYFGILSDKVADELENTIQEKRKRNLKSHQERIKSISRGLTE